MWVTICTVTDISQKSTNTAENVPFWQIQEGIGEGVGGGGGEQLTFGADKVYKMNGKPQALWFWLARNFFLFNQKRGLQMLLLLAQYE